MTKSWQPIGNISAATLVHSRIQLHSAAQLVAAVGKALARPEPDDSHTSLGWNSDRNAFFSVEVERPPVQAGLEVVNLTLVVSDPAGEKRQQLHGYTLDEAFTWIRVTLKQQGGGRRRGRKNRRPVTTSRRHVRSVRQIRRRREPRVRGVGSSLWQRRLALSGSEENQFSLLRNPRMATSLRYRHARDHKPRDASYNEPYWYVTPWPYPDAKGWPPLEGNGAWPTKDWVGAVLPTSKITGKGAEQQYQVRKFLLSAIRGSEEVLR